MINFDQKTLKRVIDINGKDKQENIAIEEMSELIKEICKSKRKYENYPHIVEEIADVYIMLEQLRIIYDIPVSDLQTEVNFKLDRLDKMLKGEIDL